MGILYLIRHGETEWNRQHRLQGWVNIRLNSRGLEQARSVASYLAATRVDNLYTSPFIRARAMAELAGEATGLTPVVLWGLREMSFGSWEGRSQDELEAQFPGFKEKWLNRPYEILFPGGDSFHSADERAREVLNYLSEKVRDEDAAAFTHGQFIRSVLCLLGEVEPSRRNQIPLRNGSITTLRYEGGGFSVVRINYVDHLSPV